MRTPGRWSLSPAYDLNPVPEIDRARTTQTSITEEHQEPSIEAALNAAPRFGLQATECKRIVGEVFAAISAWRNTGRRLRVKAATLETYASAFQNPLMDEAKTLLGK